MFLTDSGAEFYWVVLLGACLAAVIVSWGNRSLQRTFGQFGAVPASCGLTGALAARRLLAAVGLAPVAVMRSNWLNCYHPRKRQVQLLDPTFDGSTVASLAIAAHEVGHAQQFATGYWPARMRLWMRPIYYALLAAMLGLVALCFTYRTPLWAGPVVFAGAFVMLLVQVPTVLPLEYDASRRARALVIQEGLLAPYEEASFDRLLRAASRTYLAWECKRWLMILVAGAALFWMTPVLFVDESSELPAVEQVAVAEGLDGRSRLPGGTLSDRSRPADGTYCSDSPMPGEEWTPLGDWTYPLLSTFATLIPAGILVLVLTRFAKTPSQRPARRETAVARNNAGLSLCQRGEFAAALEAFSSALALDPKLHAAYFNRGDCYLRQGQLDQAMADIEASLVLNPHFVEALAVRGQIWTRRGKYDLARADFDQALQMAPANAMALTCRGNLHLVQGDHDRALADFERVIANAREHGSAYLGRARIELARGNSDAALADCCQAFALGADAGDAHSLRGSIWMDRREYDRAIADLTACLKYVPNKAWLFCNRGLAHYLKGDYPRALADLDRAIELDPAEAYAYNNRGAAYLKSGNFAAALADLQKALDLKPEFPNPHKHLAWLRATCPLADFRDGTSAVAHALRALELAEGDKAEYQAVLAAAYAEAGDFARAVEWQSRCLEASRPDALAPMRERLKLYESQQPFRDRARAGDVTSGSHVSPTAMADSP